MEYQAKAQQALSMVGSRRYDTAIPLFRNLLRYTYVVDFEYDDWLRGLADSYKNTNNPIPAGYIYLYLHYFDMAFDSFQRANSTLDLALCEEVRGDYGRAAALFRSEKRFVRAAINLERTGDWKGAMEAWETARGHINALEHPYAFALATVNLALACRQLGLVPRSRELFIEAIQIVEGLADEWKGYGFLDEALGAYHVLCLIGQSEQSFENIAEGYCNAIRILREQGQTYRVFRYYAAICEHGENLGENHAVATLHREAADYAVRTGTMYQTFYLKQAAEAYMRVAGHTREAGNFLELAENAYLAAIDAFNQMGDIGAVERCYRALATLELEEERIDRYKRIAAETRTLQRQPPEVYPPSRLLLTAPELPRVWRDELLDWEAGDEPMAVLTNIVWNLEFGDVARRHALNLILYHLDLREKNAADDPELLREIAQAMGGLRYSVAYKTLRRLVESPHVAVRAEVMTSAGRMGHPKGFILLELGLVDKDETVRAAALEAIKSHSYPEAYDHLVRLCQDHTRPETRRVLVETLGQLGTFEAAEYLWGLLKAELENHSDELWKTTADVLRRMLNAEWRAIFQSRLSNEPDEIKARLRPVIAS